MVSSSDSCLTSSAGGAGATVHRYSFFEVNALLQYGHGRFRVLVRECIFHSQVLHKANKALGLPISRILSCSREGTRQSFLLIIHCCMILATYPFRLTNELSGHLSSRERETKLTRSCSQWGLSCSARAESLTGPAILLSPRCALTLSTLDRIPHLFTLIPINSIGTVYSL